MEKTRWKWYKHDNLCNLIWPQSMSVGPCRNLHTCGPPVEVICFALGCLLSIASCSVLLHTAMWTAHKCFQFLQQICWRSMLFHLLKELLGTIGATWLCFMFILCKASWQKCQLPTCVWFACSSHEARKHVNFSLFAKFWHTRGLHLHLGCVASLSNLSGTAHAIGFPQHVDTTAASHKSQNCQHALADVCKNYTAKYKCKNYQRTHTIHASIFIVIRG